MSEIEKTNLSKLDQSTVLPVWGSLVCGSKAVVDIAMAVVELAKLVFYKAKEAYYYCRSLDNQRVKSQTSIRETTTELTIRVKSAFINIFGIVPVIGGYARCRYMEQQQIYNNLLGEKAFNEGNYPLAISHLTISAWFGNAFAQSLLGDIYIDHCDNDVLGKYWLELAARQNDAEALNKLGVLCDNSEDYTKAKYYYEKAAEQKDSASLFNLANLYENGLGVQKDIIKAFEYCKQSAELGDTEGMCYVANMLEEGRGVPRDHDQAKVWYKKAIDLGDEDAPVLLEALQNKEKEEKQKAASYTYRLRSLLGIG